MKLSPWTSPTVIVPRNAETADNPKSAYVWITML